MRVQVVGLIPHVGKTWIGIPVPSCDLTVVESTSEESISSWNISHASIADTSYDAKMYMEFNELQQ